MTAAEEIEDVRKDREAELRWKLEEWHRLGRRIEELTTILGGVPWAPGSGVINEAQGW